MRREFVRTGWFLVPGLIAGMALTPPTQAFEPITMIAREIIKSTVKEFIHNRVMDGLKAQMGQCAFMLAQVGAGSGALKYQAAQASLNRIDRFVDLGANAMPIPSLGGPSIPDADMAAMKGGTEAMKRAAGQGGGIPGIPGMPPGMPQIPQMPGMPAGMPSIPNLPAGMPSMPNMPEGMPSMAGMPNMPNMPSMPAGVTMPGMPNMAGMGRMMSMPGMGGGASDLSQLMSPDQMAAMGGGMPPEQMAQVQQMMAQMSQAAPLNAQETAEMGDRMVVMSEMFKDLLPAEQRCSPEDTRTSITLAASMPMASGAMRMMLDAYRKMDVQIAESRKTFDDMSPQARQEFVDSALADYRAMEPEEQKAYGMMVNGNFFGMPDDMQASVKAAIAAGT